MDFWSQSQNFILLYDYPGTEPPGSQTLLAEDSQILLSEDGQTLATEGT